MRRNASSNGRRKLGHQVASRWRCFRAIAGKGENKHVDEADLVVMAPRLEGKGPGHSDGASKPGIESGPIQSNTKIKMPIKVPDRIANLDQRIHMDPALRAQFLPGGRAGAEGIADGRAALAPRA